MQVQVVVCLSLFCLISFVANAFEVDNFTSRNENIQDSGLSLDAEINRRLALVIDNANKVAQSKSAKTCDKGILKDAAWGQFGAKVTDWGGLVGSIESFAQDNANVEKILPTAINHSVYKGTQMDSFTSAVWWAELWRKIQLNASETTSKAKRKINREFPNLLLKSDPMQECSIPKDKQTQMQAFIQFEKKQMLDENPKMDSAKWDPFAGQTLGLPGGQSPSQPTAEELKIIIEQQNCIRDFLFVQLSDQELVKFKQKQKMQIEHFKKQGGEVKSGLQPTIKVHGHIIGIDKLGHFFDQGAGEYRAAYLDKKGIEGGLKVGKDEEEGGLGLISSKVKSFGDLAANYNGMRFWHDLLDSDFYFKCVDGRFEPSEKFSWNRYVNDSWDEGINCSEYASSEMETQITKNLKSINMTCPADAEKCRALANLVSGVALKETISPKCLKLINTGRTNANQTDANISTGDSQ